MNSKKTMPAVPTKPDKPLKDDCCDSGCTPCVWDIYYDELDAWQKAKQTTEIHDADSSDKAK